MSQNYFSKKFLNITISALLTLCLSQSSVANKVALLNQNFAQFLYEI